MAMEWEKLLNNSRFMDSGYSEQANRSIFVQDLDRITFSTPFRRLANKTQVHPLYDNDHIHHRLIHSVETSSVGKSLGMAVGKWLEEEAFADSNAHHAVAGTVQAACLAHDIGNPPFGHSGEKAIGTWFAKRFDQAGQLIDELNKDLQHEFVDFEGNAQGFRILARLEMYRNEGGMRLSHGVLATFAKYPVTALIRRAETESYCGLKKFGLFESEQELFSVIAKEVGLLSKNNKAGDWWRRHPLVFLVEAADDICYNILDIEDAFSAGDLSFDEVSALLKPLCPSYNSRTNSPTLEEQVYELRARSIGAVINDCVEAFKNNYEAIMDGTFSASLIERSTKSTEFEKIESVAESRIFKSRRKTELEVFGRNTIHKVMDGLFPIYEALHENGWDVEKLDGYNSQVVRALALDLRDVNDSYTALHSMADFVSGMTDRYAVKTAEMLAGN